MKKMIDSSTQKIKYTKKYQRRCSCGQTFLSNHPKKRYCSLDCLKESHKPKQKKFRAKYRARKEQILALNLSEVDMFLLDNPVTCDGFQNRINFLKFLNEINPQALEGLHEYLKS